MHRKSGTKMRMSLWSQCVQLCAHWSCDNLTATARASVLRHHQPCSLWARLWQVPWSLSHLLKSSLEWCSEGWRNARRLIGVDNDVESVLQQGKVFLPNAVWLEMYKASEPESRSASCWLSLESWKAACCLSGVHVASCSKEILTECEDPLCGTS